MKKRTLTQREIEEEFKKAKPFDPQEYKGNQLKPKIEKKCENCNDYGVCWAYNKLQEFPCSSWAPDFMLIQNELEKIIESIEKKQNK